MRTHCEPCYRQTCEITPYIIWPSYMCTCCTYNEMLKKGGREGGRKEGSKGWVVVRGDVEEEDREEIV